MEFDPTKFGATPVTSDFDPSAFGATPIDDQPIENQVGGLQSFVQAVAKPFLKAHATIEGGVATGIAGLFGGGEAANKVRNYVTEKGVDYGYLGSVKPIGADAFNKFKRKEITGNKALVEGGLDLGGTTAEIASNFIGGGGAIKTVATGLKGQIFNATKTAVKEGAKSLGLMSFGQSLQDAENTPTDVAYNTLFGTAAGATGGLVLGPLTPLASKGFKAAKSFTKVDQLEQKLADGYKKIFNPNARQIKADSRFGNDSFKFLAQELPDLPIEVNSAGKIEADNAIEMAKAKYAAEATAYKPIIRNSGKYIDIDQAISTAKAAAKKEFDGTDLIKAERQIDDEVNAYLANNPQDVNVTANGKRFVTLARADDIKSYSWGRGKGWGSPDAEVWNDTNNLIGHSLKDLIEKELPEAPIRAMNKRLGQWKNAIDMIERRNAQVSGSGGRFTKRILQATVSSIGAGLGGNEGGIGGGITGAGTGFLTAQAIASLMSNPRVRLFAIRKILQNLQKAGRGDMIQEAEQILKEQANKYLLPAAGESSYVEKPIILPTSVRETNLGLDEVRGLNQSQPNPLAKTEPIAAPTTVQNINSKKPINKTVPQIERLSNTQGGFIKAYNETGDLTTKILKDLEGKTTVSKQYILDATNRGDLKQVERDLIRELVGREGSTVNVAEFANKVKAELLPLKVKSSDIISVKAKDRYTDDYMIEEGQFSSKYEDIALPEELRGKVANYKENIYESPIATSAGDVHFGYTTKNYFGHTRIEDMADDSTRRVIEVQSDLYQKGNLEKSLAKAEMPQGGVMKRSDLKGLKQLQQYNDPTAHFRMVREEMRKAAQDGKTKIQFPTGETAMKIEGLSRVDMWYEQGNGNPIKPSDLIVGKKITQAGSDPWVITEILEGGKFKAIPSHIHDDMMQAGGGGLDRVINANRGITAREYQETFDISGKVDTNNPIYRFYEKDMQKYLNKYNSKRVVDDKGVSWIEIPITKEMRKQPVEAFGKIGINPLTAIAGGTALVTGAVKALTTSRKVEYKSNTQGN
jgi:hypothetical protein